MQGTIESVTVTLNGLQAEDPNFLGLMLQAPNGNAFEFLSWADGTGGSANSPPTLTNLNLILSDSGSGLLQTNGDVQVDCSSSPCRSADDYSQVGPLYNDTFPAPAPSTGGKALPTGSATFATQFGGGNANGTWLLYLNNWLPENASNNPSLPYGQINSWCVDFTIQSNAHPTSTSVSGSPNPASTSATVTLTANVSVTDSSGLTVDAGTVTFVDGATTLGTSSVSNGQATLSVTLAEGTHQIAASYSGTNTGTEFGVSTGSSDLRVDTPTTNPTSGSGAGPYTFCNTGPITAPGLGADSGPASPYPSNIYVTNLPGTVNAVTVTLNGFSTKDQGDLLSLLVGPGGNNLDFFSLTGSNVSNAPSPFNLVFSDLAASIITGNLTSSGTFKPTSDNANITYPQCPPNASNCASPPVGPPLPLNPFAPTNKAATAGTAILGNPDEAGVFGGTISSTYNPNGTWSLYLDDGGPTGGGETTNINGGWCVNFTENLPSVSATKSHSGNFAQGQQGAAFTVDITNNGPGPTGDPTGGTNPLTVTDTLNSAFAYAGFSGTGWNCSATAQTVTCTNGSAVAQGGSYGTLTIEVNVSPTASTTTPVTNQVGLSGGGITRTSSNSDTVTILPSAVLAVQKTHSGTFTQGQTAQWNIGVSNTAASGMTNGTITVSDTLPAGYTLASYTSTASAWSCTGMGVITCTTTAGISGGASSMINLTVNVPANSPVSVSNTAGAWGGGDLTHTSSATAATSTDTATVVQVPAFISTNSGTTPQSANVNTAFAIPLAVTVQDAGHVAISGYTVTFVAPVTGASGTFSNSSTTIIASTNGSGVASSTFTANATAGGYTVAASVAGLSAVSFSLTNISVGQAPTITSANNTTFALNTFNSFTVTTTGSPTPSITESGMLPSGLGFVDNHNGTGTLSGTPTATGMVGIMFTAANGVGSNAVQSFTLNVATTSTTTTLVSSANPSIRGKGVTLTATVSSSSGTPTGTVKFFNGTKALATKGLTGGVASYATESLPVGTNTITAVYEGNSTTTGSTSAPLYQVVEDATTTTLISSSANPSSYAETVTFTATVTSTGGTPPDGESVTFERGSTVLGTGNLTSGSASFTTSSLQVGDNSIMAVYAGDASFGGSTSKAIQQVVSKASTTTSLISSQNPSNYEQSVTFTATVSPQFGGTPTGTVKFYNGTVVLGSKALVDGSASYTTTKLAVGTDSITAAYQGGDSFESSTSAPLSQGVSQAGTTTTLTSSANPSTYGLPVTFTATVVGQFGGLATGSVKFTDGTRTLGIVNFNAGVAKYTITTLAVATHNITATYEGSTDFTGSADMLSQAVN